MKKIIVFFILSLLTANAFAKCGASGIWVFPAGPTIKQNSLILLNGYEQSQGIILGLNKKYPVYLQSGEKKVKLIVREICTGEFRMTQALLAPEEQLEAGLEYTLQFDSVAGFKTLSQWNYETGANETVKWKVTAGTDDSKPVFRAMPKEIKKTLVHYGCGPAMYVIFSCDIKDDSECLVRTTVKNLTSGKTTTYYLETQSRVKQLKIGHGMCSGAFDFDKNSVYEVSFDLVDASGNTSSWTGDKIKFSPPATETAEE
ncbi:MAG: Uncharacterized protein FD123_3439 [Bacteroidetes bacterium]|nr:MAG: Uncharacterized protein FD123_3439 [Bacteroidota bacterium]